jgi:hypothetical protein
MFSLKSIVPEFSRSFGVIIDKSGSVVETLWHTEYLRDIAVDYKKEMEDFKKGIAKYCVTSNVADEYNLKPEYKFEMACHARVTKGFDRFIKIYYGASGSGKTYNLAKLIHRYRQVFPKNSVIYASVNDVKNEPAFKALEEPVLDEISQKPILDETSQKPVMKSIIKELDLNKIETVLDVFNPIFKDSLMLFDDLDANCGVFTYTDIDPTMTPEKFKALSIKEQASITKLVDQKMEIVSKFLRLTAKSVIFNARKQHINFAYIFHSFFNNKFENELIGEASSCVVFPSKLDMSTFSRWLVAKLLFTRKEAKWFTEKRWFKWDFCEIDKTSARKFVLCNDVLKMF